MALSTSMSSNTDWAGARWRQMRLPSPTTVGSAVERERSNECMTWIADDVKILHNDWPYGLRANIVHLVVWLRFRLQEDATTGDLTVLARQQVHDFVDRTFRPQVDSSQVSMAAVDKLLWFRNWTSIKSVRGLEHFHVLLNNPDSTFIRHITNNDRPMANSRVTGKYSPIL